jgi:hypothetical protein
MANQKLTEIRAASPYAAPLAADDLLYVVQDTGTTPDERAITGTELRAAILNYPASILQRLDGAGNWKVEYVYKSADETVNNSTTLQDDDALLWATTASAVYGFELTLFITGANTTADFLCGWSVPASTTMKWSNTTGVTNLANPPDAVATQATTLAFSTDAVTFCVKVNGVVITAATTGNIQFRWAQQTAGATDLKVLAGSYIKVFRLA